jgi:hypothetical protein
MIIIPSCLQLQLLYIHKVAIFISFFSSKKWWMKTAAFIKNECEGTHKRTHHLFFLSRLDDKFLWKRQKNGSFYPKKQNCNNFDEMNWFFFCQKFWKTFNYSFSNVLQQLHKIFLWRHTIQWRWEMTIATP